MTGMIFDIQRFSVHDGPGIRTTVFMKGCALHCSWCHNPEGLSSFPQVQFWEEKCIGCGQCGSRTLQDVPACPSGALQICGREIGEEELMEVLLRDLPFYGTTGGVTFSGGECLQQPDFVADILCKAKAHGLHTTVDTSGCVPWENIRKTLKNTDLYLYDIKSMDSVVHKRYTGAGNERILKNLELLSGQGKEIWIRVPVIPGVNAKTSEMERIADYVGSLSNVTKVTLMPYHTLGKSKYKTLNMPCRYHTNQTIAQNDLTIWKDLFHQRGIPADGG